MKNRVYVAWVNSTGMDCILIGPETPCFCQHRYKNHQTDFKDLPKSRPILLPCQEPGCPCSSFTYVPKNGSQAIRCSCKHASDEHKVSRPFACSKIGCKCTGFRSSYTCSKLFSFFFFNHNKPNSKIVILMSTRLWRTMSCTSYISWNTWGSRSSWSSSWTRRALQSYGWHNGF